MNTQKIQFSTARMFQILFVILTVSILLSFDNLSLKAQTEPATKNPHEKLVAEANVDPIFSNYKGVTLGMSAVDLRAKLGEPAAKSDVQDFYIISDNETLQVFYDANLAVKAMSISFTGEKVPTCQQILGLEPFKKENGTYYLLVEYPKTHFWVSYSRTAGDSPVVTVTMKKL